MTAITPRPTNPPQLRVTVVGGGPMGMLTANEAVRVGRALGVPVAVRLFEPEALGGGAADRTSSSRCQLWCHTEGVIYSSTQPEVALALQKSVRRLKRIAPLAFHEPLALAIDAAGTGPWPQADECFRVLGVRHRSVSEAAVCALVPQVKLSSGCRAWRVRDAVMDLRILSARLAARVRASGVEIVRERVTGVAVFGDRVTGLKTPAGTLPVTADDVVVFACGANIRPLLRTAGIVVPGLRVCVSHLVASDRVGIRSLLAVLRGGVNVVPHEQADGRVLDVFGNSGRTELVPEDDCKPLRTDPAAVERICREVQAQLGVTIPVEGRLAWPAAKTEMFRTGDRSQAHHAQLVPGLANGWLAVPGKLSQSAECARDLALKVIRRRLDGPVAMSIWERAARLSEGTPQADGQDTPESVFPILVKSGA